MSAITTPNRITDADSMMVQSAYTIKCNTTAAIAPILQRLEQMFYGMFYGEFMTGLSPRTILGAVEEWQQRKA